MPTPAEIDEALAAVQRLAASSPGHLDAPLRLLGGGFWRGASCDRFEAALTSDKQRLQRALRDAERLITELKHATAVMADKA